MTAPDPRLRIGTQEREAAIAALGEHFAQGRLSADEFDERSDAAMSARTSRDLDVLFVDLPGEHQRRSPNDQGQPPPGQGRQSWTWNGVPMRPPPRRHPMRVLWWVVAVIVVIAVLTHLPLILLAVGIWFLVTRCAGGRRRRTYSGSGSPWARARY